MSEQYLRRKANAKRDESIMGLYISDKNMIYILKGMDTHQTKHTLFHELKHAFDDQAQGLDEEGSCDAFATLMLRLKVEVELSEYHD